jgi:uncharacterized protein (DUF697 family)
LGILNQISNFKNNTIMNELSIEKMEKIQGRWAWPSVECTLEAGLAGAIMGGIGAAVTGAFVPAGIMGGYLGGIVAGSISCAYHEK